MACVSYQTTVAISKLIELYPSIEHLLFYLFVDDAGSSYFSLNEARKQFKMGEEILGRFGLYFKGVAFSTEDPPTSISEDGIETIANHRWNPEADTYTLIFPQVFMGKKKKGRLLEYRLLEPDSSLQQTIDFFKKEPFTTRILLSKQLPSTVQEGFSLHCSLCCGSW